VSAQLLIDDAPQPGDLAAFRTAARAMNRDADRCTITVQPMRAIAAQHVWTIDSYALPVPPVAIPYVRDAGEWRRAVVASIQYFIGSPSRTILRRRAADWLHFRHLLVYLGPGHNDVGDIILALFPPTACGVAGCTNWYLPYSGRLRYCSDQCRRRAAGHAPVSGGRLAACRVCGRPPLGRRRVYCGEVCQRADRQGQERRRRGAVE
jgi:hypothetical protein